MAVTLRSYTHVMPLQDGDRERLKGLVAGNVLAVIGSDTVGEDPNETVKPTSRNDETPAMRGLRPIAGARLELATSRL